MTEEESLMDVTANEEVYGSVHRVDIENVGRVEIAMAFKPEDDGAVDTEDMQVWGNYLKDVIQAALVEAMEDLTEEDEE